MKKIMKLFVLVAAAAMTLASCQKNEISGPVTKEVHFTINAGIAETKTTITDNGDGTYTPSWRNEDKIGIFFTEPTEKVSKVEAEFSNTKEDGETASFEGTASVEGEGTFYAFYPSSAFNQHYGDGTIRLDLPASQKPTSTSFDPACDILVAQPCDYIADGETVVIDNLYFARLMSVLRVNLVGDYAKDQIVESFSVEVDVNANVDITGNAKVDYKNATISAWNNGNINRNVVTATYTNEEYITIAGTNNAAYLVVAPVTIPSGTTLTFTIETENYDIVKTVTAPADMVMPAGNIAVINLTIAEENCTAKTEDTSDYSGEWLITGVKDEQVYAASAYVSGNNLKSVAISIENGQILEVDGIANCMMTLTKVADGDYAGMYTITDVNGKYLYAASSSGNQLKGATEVSVNAYWTVELQENGTYSIVASESSNRNVMQFNGSDANNILFNCYSSASQSPVTLYPYSMVKADTTPSITVDETLELTSAESEGTISVFYKNLEALDAAAYSDADCTVECDWLVAAWENEAVSYIAEANEGEERTAYIQIYALDAEANEYTKVITVTQAAKAAEGGESGWISTPFANLKEGDQVVIVSTKDTDTWAMSNDKGTSAAPTGVTGVTYANGKLTVDPAENIIWHVGVDGNNRIFYKDSGKATWLYCTGANNGVRVGTNEAKTFTFESNYLKHVGTSRYVGVYTTNPDWRCYTSISTNIQGQTFQFFVKTGEGGGETPEPELQERNLAFSSTTATATVGEDFTEPTLSGATAGVTYSSSNTSVATVNENTGEVTLVAAGETTISATAAADATYKADEASYTLTVSAAQGGGDEGGETTGGYTLVTSLSDITTGQYVIAAKVNGTYYAMSNVFASKINGTSVTVTENAISESDAVDYVVTITKNGTSFSISSGTKYLKYNSGTNLGTQTDAYNWTITEGTNGTFRATSGTSGRGILYRAGNYNQFGGYSLGNATSTSTEYFDIELFKLN